MNNLINKQAAIEEFWKLDIEVRPSVIDAITNMLKTLPSAEPERKTGKWVHEIDTGADMLKCSACECRVIELEYKTAVGLQGFTYCPYCGAKMEVADGK